MTFVTRSCSLDIVHTVPPQSTAIGSRQDWVSGQMKASHDVCDVSFSMTLLSMHIALMRSVLQA